MEAIYCCGNCAYRSERDFLALTDRAERRQASRIAPPAGLRSTEPFFLIHYSEDVKDDRKPDAVSRLEGFHEDYLRAGLIERIALMTWNGVCYTPGATIEPQN
jgi:hypothetical protein